MCIEDVSREISHFGKLLQCTFRLADVFVPSVSVALEQKQRRRNLRARTKRLEDGHASTTLLQILMRDHHSYQTDRNQQLHSGVFIPNSLDVLTLLSVAGKVHL